MDKSKSRRVLMEKQLAAVGLLKESSRIRAMTPNSVIIPESLATPYECKLLEKSQYSQVHELKKRPGNRVLIDALCGRPRNSKKEIVVTASHLQALRTAVNSYSHSDYALILEDDMEFAFDVDFHALAESAPKGFAVLQLITSNDQNLKYLWKKYTSSNGQDLWEQRSDVTDFWCAGAYLINKAVMRPVVNRIVHRATSNGWYAMSLIAAYDCKPSYCCDREGDVINPKTGVRTGEIGNALAVGLDYNNETRYKDKIQSGELNPSCIRAPRGITADHFIFEMARPHAYVNVTGTDTGSRCRCRAWLIMLMLILLLKLILLCQCMLVSILTYTPYPHLYLYLYLYLYIYLYLF